MSDTIAVRFDVLHAYAEKNRLDYNDLCRVVRDAIAAASPPLPKEQGAVPHQGEQQ